MQTVFGASHVEPARVGLHGVMVELFEPAARRRIAARRARHHEVVEAAKRAQSYETASEELRLLLMAFIPNEATCDAILRVESRPLALDLGFFLTLIEPAFNSHEPLEVAPVRVQHIPQHDGSQKRLSDGYWSGTLGRVRWRPHRIHAQAEPNPEVCVT